VLSILIENFAVTCHLATSEDGVRGGGRGGSKFSKY
jgi:hypothetical protein